MPPVEITDFTSYDLGRVHLALNAALAELGPSAYGIHVLWGAAQDILPWDQRNATCWADPSFEARYHWLRARLVPAGSGHDYPLDKIATALAALVNERMALDAEDEPF